MSSGKQLPILFYQIMLAYLVVASSVRDRAKFLGDSIAHRVGLAILDVDGTDEQVIRDVVQMPTELEPGASSRNVVCGALPFDLGWVSREDRPGWASEKWMKEEAFQRQVATTRTRRRDEGYVKPWTSSLWSPGVPVPPGSGKGVTHHLKRPSYAVSMTDTLLMEKARYGGQVQPSAYLAKLPRVEDQRLHARLRSKESCLGPGSHELNTGCHRHAWTLLSKPINYCLT